LTLIDSLKRDFKRSYLKNILLGAGCDDVVFEISFIFFYLIIAIEDKEVILERHSPLAQEFFVFIDLFSLL